MHAHMIRADGHMLRRVCEVLRDANLAAPIESFHASIG